ncbi:hypothetical protein SDC9_172077 [bioreactor metagenome]|uniref:Uncharacterized protein n=1 Tax=bioreactor metagenome TaxID=1076179 RepID=A0A645GDB9_9ZZZZ
MMTIISPINRAGVRNLPTMSTTDASFTHSTQISTKNAIEATSGFTPGKMGETPISKVVAAVLGMASIGPTHSTTSVDSSTAGILPMRQVIPSISLSHFSMARMASIASPISAM